MASDGCRSCLSLHIMGYVLLRRSMRLHIVGTFVCRIAFRVQVRGSCTMSLHWFSMNTLAYASVLECSESRRLHIGTRHRRRVGRSGAEHSIYNLTSFPAKPCEP